MSEKVLLSFETGIQLPQQFHTATGEIQGMMVVAKSQCAQRAQALVGAFINTVPEEGFQRAHSATYQAIEMAKAESCAAEVCVYRHS